MPIQTSLAAENPFLPDVQADDGATFFRGKHFDGHSPEIHLADSWPDAGPAVLWVRELGQGYSGFVAVEDRVFTQGQNLSGQSVYCLEADTGAILWKYNYDWSYEGMGVYPGPRGTPTYFDGRVYFSAPKGLVGCLNAETGKLIWSRNVLEEYSGTGGDGFGYSCTPVISDGMVLLPVGGKSASIVALDAQTGKEIWASGDAPGSYASAYPIERNSRKLVVGYLQNAIVIHDRLTGELLAQIDLSQGYDEHSCWPIYDEPYLWTAAPFRAGSRLYKLPEEFDGKSKVETVWSSKLMSNDVVSSVLIDEHLYGFDIFDVQSKTQRPSRGMFRCIEFATGEEKWSQGTGRPRRGGAKDDPDEIGQSNIIVADEKLIVFNERGELFLIKVDPEELHVLARTNLLGGELTWSPPLLHRGRLYVRNHSRAVCVYIGEPELLNTGMPTLRVADLPEREYRDWSAWVLPVEPEYMFDVPSVEWLWNWYLAGLVILISSGGMAMVFAFPFPTETRPTLRTLLATVISFFLGAAGTTVLSQHFLKFYFTWPVCLFVMYAAVVAAARSRSNKNVTRLHRWRERLILVAFALTCVGYFWLCRRLSLVFEWSFLIGFVGATPFLLLKQWLSRRHQDRELSKGSLLLRNAMGIFLLFLAYSGFYLSGVMPLILRY